MDPHSTHSRHSQYNNQQRRPKYGPSLQNIRQMEVKTTNVFEYFRKDSTSSLPTSTSLTSKVSKENVSRPIASNSRVRRDEKYKRDMYLAFIDNALTQKARVSYFIQSQNRRKIEHHSGCKRTLWWLSAAVWPSQLLYTTSTTNTHDPTIRIALIYYSTYTCRFEARSRSPYSSRCHCWNALDDNGLRFC